MYVVDIKVGENARINKEREKKSSKELTFNMSYT